MDEQKSKTNRGNKLNGRFIPCTTLALLLPSLPRVTQIRGHIAGLSPPSPLRDTHVPSFLSREECSIHFLPSSTRIGGADQKLLKNYYLIPRIDATPTTPLLCVFSTLYLYFPPIYVQHDQCPCSPCLRETTSDAVITQTTTSFHCLLHPRRRYIQH